jgi:uncharacterized membrane protein (UPF0127 family)
MKMKIAIVCGVAVFLIAGALFIRYNQTMPVASAVCHGVLPTRHIIFAGVTLCAEVATDGADLMLGLSGRGGLDDGTGMLFVFPEEGYLGFWMKDMNFPIDILWFDSSRRLIHSIAEADPASYPEVFYPSQKARFVLEVPSGFIATHDVQQGDRFEFKSGY